MKSLLKIFIILRLLSVPVIQTWFVPDETWQSTEIAHGMIYKFGYRTWEWHNGLRSILYPGLFALIFKIFNFFTLDFDFILIQAPRVLSAILFAVGDYFFHKTFMVLFGDGSDSWVAICLFTSWFLSYCSPRTLTSCMEMTLLAITLNRFPWKKERDKTNINYLWWGGLGCIIRPTFAIHLLPFCVKHLVMSKRKPELLVKYCLTIFAVLAMSVFMDSLYYGELTIVPWNFFKFNVMSGLANHYGTHSWHWYFTQGLPVTLGIHLLPLTYGLFTRFKKYSCLIVPCLWSILVHSFLEHKEFRFLLPIIPILLGIAGDSIHNYIREHRRIRGINSLSKSVAIILIIPNLFALIYMGCIHQRGPIASITELRTLIRDHESPHVVFLTPCHSTPLYSHLHVNATVKFLTCEPNLKQVENYKDEADIFFENPVQWLRESTVAELDVSHIVMFDSLALTLEDFLQKNNYKLCSQVFNAHFFDGYRSKYILIFCR